jgi:hypothetical protein
MKKAIQMALVNAQEALTTAKIRADKVANFKPTPLQKARDSCTSTSNDTLLLKRNKFVMNKR